MKPEEMKFESSATPDCGVNPPVITQEQTHYLTKVTTALNPCTWSEMAFHYTEISFHTHHMFLASLTCSVFSIETSF